MTARRSPTAQRWRVVATYPDGRVSAAYTCWAKTAEDAVERLRDYARPSLRGVLSYRAERIA